VQLVNELPEDKSPPTSPWRDPDQARFLTWVLPLGMFCILFISTYIFPSAGKSPFVVAPMVLLMLAANIGTLWMLYQAVRYEEKPARYVLLAFVPFMFIWYHNARRHASPSPRLPIAFRDRARKA
jgi:hypothetical protein